MTVTTFELEHIIPFSAGGKTVVENLCLACPACNRYKADRTVAIGPETNRNVPLFNSYQGMWIYHFRWNEDADEIIALTPTGRATISALRMNRPQLIRVRRLWVKMGEHPPNVK